MRLAVIVIALIVLSACTAKYKLVGRFDNFNEAFVGDIVHDLSTGTSDILPMTSPSAAAGVAVWAGTGAGH